MTDKLIRESTIVNENKGYNIIILIDLTNPFCNAQEEMAKIGLVIRTLEEKGLKINLKHTELVTLNKHKKSLTEEYLKACSNTARGFKLAIIMATKYIIVTNVPKGRIGLKSVLYYTTKQ
ncbi:hypothetical protein D3C81_07360 [compost metagenome]